MSSDGVRDSPEHQLSHDDHHIGFATLSTDIRLMIWRLAYAHQGPRLVEIQTLEHHHYDYAHRWCPRYSSSPPPIIVNVCREARNEAWIEARKAGHLPFATTPDASDIYFNPEIDILYVPKGNNDWIRSGPEGVLAQLRTENRVEPPRFIAIGLDVESGDHMIHTLKHNVEILRGLKVANFVFEGSIGEISQMIRRLTRCLSVRQRRHPQERGAYPDRLRLVARHGTFLHLIRSENIYPYNPGPRPQEPLLACEPIWCPALHPRYQARGD